MLDIVGQAFKAVAGGVGELIGLFLPAGNGVLSLTGSFGEYLVKLDETVKKTDVFGKAVSTVVDIVKTAITFVKTAGEKVKEFGKLPGRSLIFLDLNYSTHSLNEYMIAWLRLVMVLEK